MAEGATRLNANGREALRLIARADEAYTGGETWDERNYPGIGRIQYIHWRTTKALVARGLITSTFAYEDEDDNRTYNVHRLELTADGRAWLAGEQRG